MTVPAPARMTITCDHPDCEIESTTTTSDPTSAMVDWVSDGWTIHGRAAPSPESVIATFCPTHRDTGVNHP